MEQYFSLRSLFAKVAVFRLLLLKKERIPETPCSALLPISGFIKVRLLRKDVSYILNTIMIIVLVSGRSHIQYILCTY